MKFHFKIVSTVDRSDVYMDSKTFMVEGGINGDDFEGYNTKLAAEEMGENKRDQIGGGYKDNYIVVTYPVAENVEEEDMLDGHMYPGHETWDDDDYHDANDDEIYQL